MAIENSTPTASASALPTLRQGDQGPKVMELQQRLATLGHDPGAIDGAFGPNTKAAVLAFQRTQGLSVDGVVGPQTWAALTRAAPVETRATLRRGSSGPDVRYLQSRLNALGMAVGAVDGDFGPQTESAVRAFQRSRGLSVDGVVGPQTWRALAGPSISLPVPSGGISLATLRQVMTQLPLQRAQAHLPHLNAAMGEAAINTRLRIAAFLAQLAHESVELQFFEEIASGDAYEGRVDLGNTQPGDGRRYKGRGPIQLTGRANYRAAGNALGIDLEGHPTRAADLDVGYRVAGWYWTSRGLNALADLPNFREITRRINGGFNGQASRERYYNRALAVL